MDDRFTRQEGIQYWRCLPTGETSIVCAGLAQRVPETRVTSRTTFHCFSTTKPVTALAVLQLVAQGNVE